MTKQVLIQSGDAKVYGQFKSLDIGRPCMAGDRWGKRVLRVLVVLEGTDEDIEKDLEKFQRRVSESK